MLSDNDKERLRRVANGATPGPRRLVPRDIGCFERLENGDDPIDVAATHDNWCLGWELEDGTGFTSVSRGEFRGPDAALIMATPPEVIIALLDEIEQLKGNTNA